MDNIDLRLLRVFVAVVEGRGFSAAQTQLNVGASTISNHMTALETRLGVTLCQRGRAGFRLTPDGEVIFGETQRLFAALEAFEFKIGTLHGRKRASLALGIVDNTITDKAAPLHRAIAQFVQHARDVQLHVECRPPNELLQAITDGRIDVAIGSFPKILLGLTYRRLYDEEHYFYCGKIHPLFDKPDHEISSDMIANHTVISRDYWANRDVRHIRSERTTAYVDSMEAEARLILSGSYLGYLPAHYADHWVLANEMRVIQPEKLKHLAPFEVAHAANAIKRPGIKRFIRSVLEIFDQPVDEALSS
jgi:DNA-binding transcriptional LysR family regulator